MSYKEEEDNDEVTGNEGVLEGLACPMCEDQGPFDIEVLRWVTVSDSGDTDDEGGDTTWEDDSRIRCLACGHEGTILTFTAVSENNT